METSARSTTLAIVVPAIPWLLITSMVASIIFCRFQALMASRPTGLGSAFAAYEKWEREVEQPLRVILSRAITTIPLTAESRVKYERSATEQELSALAALLPKPRAQRREQDTQGRRASSRRREGVARTRSNGQAERGKTKGSLPNPFHNVHGAGYRGVYDFADPNSSVFIISTGQSGHFLSRHYDDLAQLWRRGEYIPMSLDEDLARAANEGITILTPED